jgi:hypothetical protein
LHPRFEIGRSTYLSNKKSVFKLQPKTLDGFDLRTHIFPICIG